MSPNNILGDRGCIGELRRRIMNSMVSSSSHRRFLPTNKLNQILTLEAIKSAVGELICVPQDRINLANTIHANGKRVFAMLIYNGCPDRITEFRKLGFLDRCLPLSDDDMKKIDETSLDLRLALEAQWSFHPYTFPERMWEWRRTVDDKTILPIIGVEQIGTGAFGEVEKISIPSSEQHFIDDEAELVQLVRKRLKDKNTIQEFEREETCLRLLNQLQHPNIISFWGSYTYQGEYNFLFPYHGMDLRTFLQSELRYADFQWDFTFYSALAGLASALSKTHNPELNPIDHDVYFEAIGYHHDIRPPNILVSSDTFILADFGLGNLKLAEALLSHTPYKSISGDYIAPECTDMDENAQRVNRAIDVWAMGCLIAEVVTYMLKGKQGLESFRKQRLTEGRLSRTKDAGFYQPHGCVKQEVIDWMNDLKCCNPESDLIVELLDISLQALQSDPQVRPKMDIIYQRLVRLSVKKHFESIQNKFCEVLRTGGTSMSGFRFALETFQDWGNSLSLVEHSISDFNYQSAETAVTIMKQIFGQLGKGADAQDLEDQRRIVHHHICELWNLLPQNLRPAAENRWTEQINDEELAPKTRDSYEAARDNHLKSEFEKAALEFKGSLHDSISGDEILKITSIQSVYDVTDAIQKEQSPSDSLCNLERIRQYLEHLEGNVSIIGDIVHGDNQVLAVIWGPIAFMLQHAKVCEKAFNSILTVFAQIGEMLPDFSASASLFNERPEAREITLLFFKDLLNLYRELLQPFGHPDWLHVFDRL
ncbi:kinase-like domain-containing protein [Nemania sp. FL0916]|nr:kinase-like domain-containing protein [Nemania sp. FL0916]